MRCYRLKELQTTYQLHDVGKVGKGKVVPVPAMKCSSSHS